MFCGICSHLLKPRKNDQYDSSLQDPINEIVSDKRGVSFHSVVNEIFRILSFNTSEWIPVKKINKKHIFQINLDENSIK